MEFSSHARYITKMRRAEVIARLKKAEPLLKGLGVEALYLFGSHARDDAGPDSDIDLFVDPTGTSFEFLPFMSSYETLRETFGPQIEIGYSTRAGLSSYILKDVEREAVRIF
jgi:uncharacterized protein